MQRLTWFAAVVLALTVTPSFADTVYTYTGNLFTTVVGTPPEGTSDRITGSFSLVAPLGDNLNDVTLESDGVGMLTSFSFSDGVFSYGLASAGGATVKVSTGPTGLITEWAVSGAICCPTPPAFATQDGLSNGYSVGSDAFIDSGGTAYFTAYAYNTRMPGTWSTTTSPVPEPSSLLLVVTGMVGLTPVFRRLRSKEKQTDGAPRMIARSRFKKRRMNRFAKAGPFS